VVDRGPINEEEERVDVTRQRRVVAVLTAVVLLLLGLVLPWPGPLVGVIQPDRTTPGPSVPSEFPSYSALTASAFTSPAGRAIALYEFGSSELFTSWQTLVAGADRDTYRQLTLDGDVAPHVLLSPDGTQVLFHRVRPGTEEFTLLDLATGATRGLPAVAWRQDTGAELQLLDWSPDGHYVAYAVPSDRPPGERYIEQRPVQDLAILDVRADTSVRLPDLSPVFGAVFAPDSQQLAVQTWRDGWLVTVAGAKVQPLRLPTGAELGFGSAWSPDGSLIATTVDHVAAPAGTGFIDPTGSGRAVPAEITVAPVLGWRTSTSVLAQSFVDDGNVIVEASIVDGHQTVLSGFSRAQNCEFWTQRCEPFRIQLATGLIGGATVRPSHPDGGPWSPLVHAGVAALLAVVAALLVLAVRRRHPDRSAPTPNSLVRALERTP
jgi:hypothetical protein